MNNCVIYLVRTSDYDVMLLHKSIGLLTHKKGMKEIPIIIFHEKSLSPYLEKIKTFHTNIIFNEIEFSLPSFYNSYSIPEYYTHDFIPGQQFSMGYRHMCRFFSGEIFKQDILKGYDNCLRLDTDSFIIHMDFDLFKSVENNKIYYGYLQQAVQYDNPGVIEGLYSFIENDIEEGLMYYTNFEIYNLNWFRQKEYMDFYNKIDKSGNIFTKRWGDAPIRYLGVNTLMNKENIYGFDNIKYHHGSFKTF